MFVTFSLRIICVDSKDRKQLKRTYPVWINRPFCRTNSLIWYLECNTIWTSDNNYMEQMSTMNFRWRSLNLNNGSTAFLLPQCHPRKDTDYVTNVVFCTYKIYLSSLCTLIECPTSVRNTTHFRKSGDAITRKWRSLITRYGSWLHMQGGNIDLWPLNWMT